MKNLIISILFVFLASVSFVEIALANCFIAVRDPNTDRMESYMSPCKTAHEMMHILDKYKRN